jgi:hypothetical protein
VLEPDDGKPSSPVLRGLGASNGARPLASNPFHRSRGPLAAILPPFPRHLQPCVSPGQSSQTLFLGQHAPPSVRPRPHPSSGSSFPDGRFVPVPRSGGAGLSAERQLPRSRSAAEILKSQINRGARKELYYFRDQQGLEVDFLIPRPRAELWLIECKAGKTVRPAMAAPLLALRRTLENRLTRMIVVHGKSRSAQVT